jgi:hypothetical protein
MMKQRLMLVWISGFIGVVIDTLFREAPWFYIPAMMLLVYTTMQMASRSRDAATMMLLVFGYSGSIPTSDFFGTDPIIDGFQRTIGVTIGVIVAITIFFIFPMKKNALQVHSEPINFGKRELLFLSVTAGISLIVGAAIIKHYGTFVVMLGLAWALGLPRQSAAVNHLQLLGLALGNCVALILLSVFSASSNNLAFYIAIIATIVGIAAYLGASIPQLKPAQGLFIIGILVPISFAFKPLPNVTVLFPMFFSMWLGVLIASLLFFIFRALEKIEKRALEWGSLRVE